MYDVIIFVIVVCAEREKFTQYGGGLVRMNVLSVHHHNSSIYLKIRNFRSPDNAFFELKLSELTKLRLGIHHLYELLHYVLPSRN